ncbi:MAG: ParA family protein [Kiloniellales bacterium]|nr:ParA family protein [Kiloniellales bacterium]
MRVLAFASQKGGSGKTTLAANVAVQAEREGSGPVALIDTDPQGSLAEWWNQRSDPTPVFAHVSVAHLPEHIAQMEARGIKLLVIDTPPAIKATIGHVVNAADLVVIPVRPSPHDLRAAGKTVDIVESLGKPLVFVINGAHPTARITTEAAISLSQHGPLCPAVIRQRTDYAASMIDGRAAMEIAGNSRSPEEIAQLWSDLKERLEKGRRHRAHWPRTAPTENYQANTAL